MAAGGVAIRYLWVRLAAARCWMPAVMNSTMRQGNLIVMKRFTRITAASVLTGGAAAAAIAVAPLALAAPVVGPGSGHGGPVPMPPGGPQAVYPRDQPVGGADPYTPYGTDPYVAFGTWTP